MDALAGATVVVDPEPYVGRLAAASPCADAANDAPSTSGGSRGVPLFASARVPPSNDAATTVRVVEDLAVFAGGAVWCMDWAPPRGGADTSRHVAVEARAKDDVAHALGDVGRARGPGLVQVMALRVPARGPGGAAASAEGATEGERPRDAPVACAGVSEKEHSARATARVVLGLAHDAGHAFDLKWRPSAERAVSAGSDGSAGQLAVALGNGRVEVWRVPMFASAEEANDAIRKRRVASGSNLNARGDASRAPAVKCASAFVGVAPRHAGVPLCVDWAAARPRNRIVAGTSAGAIVLWTLPREDADAARVSPSPTLPVMQMASTGCPQRSVRFAPPAFASGTGDAETDETETRRRRADSSFLVLAGGHGMHAPAVFDSRDPFSTSAGSRSSSFGGHNATTCVAFAPNGVVLSASDDGAVDAHDFFLDARMRRPPRDCAERAAKRTLAHDATFPENIVRTSASETAEPPAEGVRAGARKKRARRATDRASDASSGFSIDPPLALDRGAAWSVDAKPAFAFGSNAAREDAGCVLVLAGFGRAGARLAFMSLGNGLRRVNASRGKDELREAGVPVDLAFVGATATFESGTETETAGVDAADAKGVKNDVAALLRRAETTARARAAAVRVAAPARRGAGGFGSVSRASLGAAPSPPSSGTETLARVAYAPVRCVRWLDPETPVSASPDRAWCAWGDDAGFVRFQRLCGNAVAVAARAVSAAETRN